NNDIYQQFTYVTHTIISSSHPVSMLPELSLPHGSFFQSLTEGFIVSQASHKAVTSYACRDKKLPTKRQADSEVSNKRGDFQVAPGAFYCWNSLHSSAEFSSNQPVVFHSPARSINY
ncbi:MAG: hypothetical protein V2B20_26265, partial [Pseudomonadota bacterium]